MPYGEKPYKCNWCSKLRHVRVYGASMICLMCDFSEQQIVASIVSCLEFWRLFRGHIYKCCGPKKQCGMVVGSWMLLLKEMTNQISWWQDQLCLKEPRTPNQQVYRIVRVTGKIADGSCSTWETTRIGKGRTKSLSPGDYTRQQDFLTGIKWERNCSGRVLRSEKSWKERMAVWWNSWFQEKGLISKQLCHQRVGGRASWSYKITLIFPSSHSAYAC